jgi:hypothetical protein
VDPVRNPFAPGAGQRPPELAGRDRELDAFEIVLERVARGRPERSLVLTGLRGVGKTVLLGELRSMAVRAGWGAGKIEARPEADLRRPLSAALHRAIRDLAVRHPEPERVDEVLGILKAFALRSSPDGAKLRDRWQPGIDVAVRSGRADSGDIEIDLVELFTEVAALASDVQSGVSILIDEMQDLRPDDVSALCAACHELSQSRAPLVVVGAGLPHLPVALAASKSYAERLFRYVVVDRLPREMADRALLVPAGTEDVDYTPEALDELYALTWDTAVASPIQLSDVQEAAPEAEGELAVGFFGARYDRATPAEREYMRVMADLAQHHVDGSVQTSDIARSLSRKPQSLSPARDGLIKKGLVYSSERGTVAFTVPHFGKFLRGQRV